MTRNDITLQSTNIVPCQSCMSSEQFNFSSTMQNNYPFSNSNSFLSPINYNLISNSNIINSNGNNINLNQQIENNAINNQNINQSLANHQNFNLNSQYTQSQIPSSSKFSLASYQTNPKSNSTFTSFLQPKPSMPKKVGSLNSPTKQKKIRKLFSVEEDHLLTRIMYGQPFTTWIAVAAQIPGRSARQCRDRWANYLSPNNKNGPWSQNEDEILAEKHKEYGSQWTIISKFFDGRSENNVKNRWYTHLKHKYYGENQNGDLLNINSLTPNMKSHPNYSNNLKNQYNLEMPGNNNNNNYGYMNYHSDQLNCCPQMSMNPYSFNTDSSVSFKKFPQSENSIITVNNSQVNTPYINPNLRPSINLPNQNISPMKQISSVPILYDQNNAFNLVNCNETSNININFASTPKTTTMNPKKAPLPPISSLVS